MLLAYDAYWYFSFWRAVCLFIPMIIQWLNARRSTQLLPMLIGGGMLFSAVPTFFSTCDSFRINGDCSALLCIWLAHGIAKVVWKGAGNGHMAQAFLQQC